ncbi:dehydroquinase class II [Exophiala aquamarina CBS 119918]|uniref:Catabolic 3-dehydroquinase n=1 Tax=Exophiala aquamarina CBS 119918 TaxID=1182545 RepID=A0A072PB38_9EURO|nr:dehydroquinase class II [Exophiala aquamarina CBS 119918]KEF57279.1 dehydroquinase class II [Exophiala aquamarina CBS 119918]
MSTNTESTSTAEPVDKILLINGPNLNLLGLREPSIYGSTTLAQLTSSIVERGSKLNITVVPFQSNHEGAIVDFLHSHFTPATSSLNSTTSSTSSSTPQQSPSTKKGRTAVIINPAAYTHTSVAIRDALLATSMPFVEVHISNVHAREEFRHQSFLSDKAIGVVMGLGVYGYTAALEFWAGRWRDEDAATGAAAARVS